ncbi:hypothetical protein CNEO4_1510007 [Clostridium neonatale]|uniref:Uncharacterized protein n=1 Tax=Clostridium neonatale TaxID=137838 RepID=A0AA86JKF6_9CLOT|nr:hypothetical protein CNEO_30025 [Clostridium neonatale]CAG9702385.1 hypothetical protein CNEO_30036 [Clostridium neonatale]CAG9713752.1 hypothetical protein CNEO_50047 [Clostridium neonatale]CAG9713803.1 hypothetical protein CNEO_60007 [Clostridium neonatale]CAG9713831.1 hypothetical protein CNEO_60021 [Clostridium neonatale]
MIAKRHNREDNRDNSQKRKLLKYEKLVCFYIPFHVISKLNKKKYL